MGLVKVTTGPLIGKFNYIKSGTLISNKNFSKVTDPNYEYQPNYGGNTDYPLYPDGSTLDPSIYPEGPGETTESPDGPGETTQGPDGPGETTQGPDGPGEPTEVTDGPDGEKFTIDTGELVVEVTTNNEVVPGPVDPLHKG